MKLLNRQNQAAGMMWALICTVLLVSCSQEEACKPVSAAHAGTDLAVTGSATNLNASTPERGTGSWTIVSGNGGELANAADPQTVFSGVPGETYLLRWTIAGCKSNSDDVEVAFQCDVVTTAQAGADQSLAGTEIQMAANEPTVGIGTWSIQSGAGGSFDDENSSVSRFTGTLGETYVLRWTITSEICENQSSFDDVEISLEYSFDLIDRNLIVSKEGSMSSNVLVATNETGEVLAPGAFLIYKTNANRYGKLEIVEWDEAVNYRLVINVVTYNEDGTVFTELNNLEIDGTWLCDLDAAVQTADTGVADFHNARMTMTNTNFAPSGTAKFHRLK
jgi:hypothetical protein